MVISGEETLERSERGKHTLCAQAKEWFTKAKRRAVSSVQYSGHKCAKTQVQGIFCNGIMDE